MAQDLWTLQEKGKRVKNRRTGRHCRPVLQLPTGQSVQLPTMILAHMDMDRGQSKMNGANDEKGSGHGMAKASRQT